MPYTVHHTYVDEFTNVSVHTEDGVATISFSASGSLPIRHPGRFLISKFAKYSLRFWVEDPNTPGHGRWVNTPKSFPVKVEIITPREFPHHTNEVTMDDLTEYRDQRGTTRAEWSFRAHGETTEFVGTEDVHSVSAGRAFLRIQIVETVASKSAPPIVDASLALGASHSYKFDISQVGTFVAELDAEPTEGGHPRGGRLLNPNGDIVAITAPGSSRLTYPITLETLGTSWNEELIDPKWTLNVRQAQPGNHLTTNIRAQVIASARIHTHLLQERIDYLLGLSGNKLSIFGETRMDGASESEDPAKLLLARLQILDEITAETIDMHGLLDHAIGSQTQDPGVNLSKDGVTKDTVYTIGSYTFGGEYGLGISLDGMRVSRINISVGAGQWTQVGIPALKAEVGVDGEMIVDFHGFPLATVKVRDNHLRLEAGLRLGIRGSVAGVTWVEPRPLDVDLHWAAAVAAGILSPALLLLGSVALLEYIESRLNKIIRDTADVVITSFMARVPEFIAVVMGDDFTYRSVRLEGDDIVFDYEAPREPNPRMNSAYEYMEIMGRGVNMLGIPPFGWQITPPSLGNTFADENLRRNIDHIVVVVMENRSFDHLLGYRSLLNGAGTDGLTPELTSLQDFPITRLKEAGFDILTKFPKGVGHTLADVTQQLSATMQTPSGRFINSPKGFVDNFAAKHHLPQEGSPVKPTDVLGYYEAADLPFFKYLAENYAYCDRYFSSHAGPTLPNRMFTLTGTIYHDRTGEAVLDNSYAGNFSMSRDQTIFDLLTMFGVSWRIYESFPSLTMLRLFSRYASDDTNIVRYSKDRLQQDVVQGNLPAVTFVEPALHHYPPTDDHPPADMLPGQMFLKDVYDALRSNPDVWRRTMLIITYDEHGGFYDHVIPPMAEARIWPTVISHGHEETGGYFTPQALATYYGVRVPTFVVSPWVRAGKGPDIVLDHCSILKTIIARFLDVQSFLSERVHWSRSFDSYVSELEPRMNVPDCPPIFAQTEPQTTEPTINTKPISRKQMRSGDVEYHDLTGMLARMLGRNSQ